MLLKSLSLKNIRSYSHVKIDFKSGSTLLSGDIGSGKTTILLAIEFALFGIMRGIISGNALLRNGKSTGEVELEFEIDSKSITVMRSLKKTNIGVVQDSGYVIINGLKTEGTAIELKSIVLELLGYPEDLLTKSKTMIYRYTVYTPQEEMKMILYEDPEERIEKIRRLFDVDKYRRVKDNSSNYAKELRTEIKILGSAVQGIDEIKNQIKDSTIKIEEKKKSVIELKLALEKKKLQESKIQAELEKTQSDEKNLLDLKSQHKVLLSEKAGLLDRIKGLDEEKADISIEIAELESKAEKKEEKKEEIPIRTILEIKADIEKYTSALNETDDKLLKAKNRSAILESQMNDKGELIKNISSMDTCPTCGQKVTEGHKHFVEDESRTGIKALEEKNSNLKDIIIKASAIRESISKRIETLREEMKKSELGSMRQKMEEEKARTIIAKKKRKELLEKNIIELKEKIISNNEKQEYILKNISTIKIDERTINILKEDLKKAREETRKSEISLTESVEQQRSYEIDRKRLETELDKKQKDAELLQKKRTLEHWLTEHFINLVDLIERHVLSQIQAEFSERFEEWFKMLLEDEDMAVRLDASFTPIIIQNGYETELDNLSGGEKTSVALAYRLALNKVINDFMTTIKTRDLIILDEPTDGFSSEQLDKVREVLSELNCKQTIIVSHEPKMESFVENIIRIRKNEHLSEANI